MCEQAEHVKSPQEHMKMVYDVTMKTRTNLCRNIGVITKPLNGVSIRKNVSCGSFYNTEAQNTIPIPESSGFQLFIVHIMIRCGHFHFQFLFERASRKIKQ